MLEDEADEDEVDGYRDGIDTHGSYSGAPDFVKSKKPLKIFIFIKHYKYS